MGLKIQLVSGNKVIYQLPLSIEDWERETLEEELDELEADLSEILEVNDILSNRTRLRLLCKNIRDVDSRFTEFMEDLDSNQKVISENLHRMMEMELIERTEKNSREIYYNPSELGFASILTCLTMRKVLGEVKRKRR
jgi:DNA-binding HxlR family transcriptional regulator